MDIQALVIPVDARPVTKATEEMGKLSNAAGYLEGIFKKLAAAVGLWKIAQMAQEIATMAARYETLGVVMTVVGNNAGYTGKQMEAFAKSLQSAGISMNESRNSLAVMAQAHIDLSKATQLGRLAQDAAVIGNMNSSEAFQAMIHGIQSGQTEILRTIGINVNFENSYKALADQLHKHVADLSEVEKAQARTNAVLGKTPDLAGAYAASMETAGKQLLSMKRYADDARTVLGAIFSDAFGTSVHAINQGLIDMKKWLTDNAEAARTMNAMLGSAAQNFVGLVKDVLGLASDMSRFNDEFSVGELLAGALAVSMAALRDIIMAAVGAVEVIWGSINSLVSGALLGASRLFERILGFKPPKWLENWFNGSLDRVQSGMGHISNSATAALYSGGDIGVEVAADQARKAKEAQAEQARLAAGIKSRQDAEKAARLAAAAKEAEKIAESIKKESESLEREIILLRDGERAAYAYDLMKEKITGKAAARLMLQWDQVDALKEEAKAQKELESALAKDRQAAEAKYDDLMSYRDAYDKVSMSAREYLRLQLDTKGYTDDEINSTLALVDATNALTDAKAKKDALDKEVAKLNLRSNYTTSLAHLEELNATDNLAPDVYREQLHKLLLESQTIWGAIAYSVENFADRGSSALANFFNGTKTGFREMVSSMLVDLEKLILKQQIVQPLLNSAGEWFSGMLGGSNYGTSIGSSDGYVLSGGRAAGGPVMGGSTYLVGERGPELFTPRSSGSITPNHALGGVQVSNQVSIKIDDSGVKVQGSAGGQAIGESFNNMCTAWAIKERRPGGVLNPVFS